MPSVKIISFVILLFIFNICTTNLLAQEARDNTGNWLMYWGTNRVSEKVSIWTEAQYRLYFALGYQFSSQGQVQAGYLFQTLPRETLERLQFAFVYNLDFLQ